jgi:hypothetical protein
VPEDLERTVIRDLSGFGPKSLFLVIILPAQEPDVKHRAASNRFTLDNKAFATYPKANEISTSNLRQVPLISYDQDTKIPRTKAAGEILALLGTLRVSVPWRQDSDYAGGRGGESVKSTKSAVKVQT